MGRVFKKLDTWSFFVLTPHPRFETLFGRKADKKRKLYNGRIECHYYQFFGPRPPRAKDEALPQ
jgi:putative N6-adenine-specific DNA methylase